MEGLHLLKMFLTSCLHVLHTNKNFSIRSLVSYYFQHRNSFSGIHAADEWGNLYSRNSFMHEITLEKFQKFPNKRVKMKFSARDVNFIWGLSFMIPITLPNRNLFDGKPNVAINPKSSNYDAIILMKIA